MRIRFLSDQVYETEGPGRGPKFPSGRVLDETEVAEALGIKDMPDGYAKSFLGRWISRNVAILEPEPEPEPEEAEVEADSEIEPDDDGATVAPRRPGRPRRV